MAIEIRYDGSDGILSVVLNTPSNGNAFSASMAEELEKALAYHRKRSGTSGLLLSATGRLFCAGGDLASYARQRKGSEGRAANRLITKVLGKITNWPHPTVCAVTGDCYGGGTELISAFDKIYSVPEAMFGFWQRKMGLTFGWGGTARISARVSEHATKRLALEARSFTSHEALALGLIDEIRLRASIESEARQWLVRTSGLPSGPVIAELKTLEPRREQAAFERLWWSRTHREILNRSRSAGRLGKR